MILRTLCAALVFALPAMAQTTTRYHPRSVPTGVGTLVVTATPIWGAVEWREAWTEPGSFYVAHFYISTTARPVLQGLQLPLGPWWLHAPGAPTIGIGASVGSVHTNNAQVPTPPFRGGGGSAVVYFQAVAFVYAPSYGLCADFSVSPCLRVQF